MQATTLAQVSGRNRVSRLLISEHRNRVAGRDYSSHKEQEDERKESTLVNVKEAGNLLSCMSPILSSPETKVPQYNPSPASHMAGLLLLSFH